jgi:hypothetical protein
MGNRTRDLPTCSIVPQPTTLSSGSIVKSIDLIGNRIRDLPACSVVHQPTALPRAPPFPLEAYTNLQEKNFFFFIFKATYILHELKNV